MPTEELREVYSLPDIVTVIRENRISWAGMWHAWERREMRAEFLWGNTREVTAWKIYAYVGGC